jgi:catechol 2,3-dioxygenase-like lactoylglutathione lyase family enzyme
MLQVADIGAARSWYERVLGLVAGHGGDEYEMLFGGEPFATPMLLQLHRWDAHEHGILGSPDVPIGNGMSLWFEVADDAALEERWSSATAASAPVLSEPAWNPNAHHHEFTVTDPDGYVVVVHSPFQPAPPG